MGIAGGSNATGIAGTAELEDVDSRRAGGAAGEESMGETGGTTGSNGISVVKSGGVGLFLDRLGKGSSGAFPCLDFFRFAG